MIDIGMGEWGTEYNEYILMKFTSSYGFQQCFLDGKLYFNTSDWFAKCEDKGRGDTDEGNTFVVNHDNPGLTSINLEIIDGQVFIKNRDYTDNPSEYKKSTVLSYSTALNRFRKAISFYTAYVNFDKKIISEFPDNMAKEFGQYGVLILDRQEFLERVVNAFRKMSNCNEARMGFVEYQKIEPGLNEWNPFRKDIDKFGYQNEFRITFVDDTKEAVLLDLKRTIRDIAVPILASDVQREIFFNGDKLLYSANKN